MLTSMTILSISSCRCAQEGEVPLIIQNTYQHPSREVFYYEGSDYTAQLAQLTTAVEQGKKVMVVSDSKSTIEKIEQILTDIFAHTPDRKSTIKNNLVNSF